MQSRGSERLRDMPLVTQWGRASPEGGTAPNQGSTYLHSGFAEGFGQVTSPRWASISLVSQADIRKRAAGGNGVIEPKGSGGLAGSGCVSMDPARPKDTVTYTLSFL